MMATKKDPNAMAPKLVVHERLKADQVGLPTSVRLNHHSAVVPAVVHTTMPFITCVSDLLSECTHKGK